MYDMENGRLGSEDWDRKVDGKSYSQGHPAPMAGEWPFCSHPRRSK